MNYKNEHRYPSQPYTEKRGSVSGYNFTAGCGCAGRRAPEVLQENVCMERKTDLPCTTSPTVPLCIDGENRIAMAYVPLQEWRDLYDTASALSHGTIFRELDLPWYPTACSSCRKDG